MINELKFGTTTSVAKIGPYNKHWFRGVDIYVMHIQVEQFVLENL